MGFLELYGLYMGFLSFDLNIQTITIFARVHELKSLGYWRKSCLSDNKMHTFLSGLTSIF